MRVTTLKNLFEITPKNETWAILKGIDIEYTSAVNHVINAYDIMTGLKRKGNYPIIIDMIDDLVFKLSKFTETKFPDIDDEDMTNHKTIAQNQIFELETLKKTLE